jgi:hypothetical protein
MTKEGNVKKEQESNGIGVRLITVLRSINSKSLALVPSDMAIPTYLIFHIKVCGVAIGFHLKCIDYRGWCQ